jgi:flavodoxin
MNTLILVHSKTGVTHYIASIIKERLEQKGNSVSLVKIETDVPVDSDKTQFNITNIPDIKGFDNIIIGCPVWAFSPTIVIIKAIRSFSELRDVKVEPFVTMGMPFEILGGIRSIKIISQELGNAGAKVLKGFIFKRKDRFNKELVGTITGKLIEELS